MPDQMLRYLNCIARLKEGVSPAAAQADLGRISVELGRAYPPTHREYGVSVRPMRDVLYGDRRPALLLLWGAVFLVHVLACVNAANLMLVQIADQRQVSAVRLALGARPGAIMRYRLAEGLIISLTAAAAGLALGALAVQAILRNFGDRDLLAPAPGGALMITAFVCGLTILTALAVSLIPSLREARIPISALLNEGSQRASASAGGRRARDFFVVAQVALAIPLLIGAALTVKRFRELSTHEIGYDPNGVLTAQLIMPGRYADRAQRGQFVAQLIRRLEEKPGVKSAAITTCTFRVGESPGTVAKTGAMADMATINFRRITDRYFETMATPLVAGRSFSAEDVLDAPPVAIVSESLAKRFWPGADPIGQTLIRTSSQVTVVGVAPDLRDSGVAEDLGPTLYVPYLQNNSIFVSILVRSTSGDAAALRDVLTKTIHEIDPHLAPDEIVPLPDLVRESLGPHRLQVFLFGGFGLIALLLAVVGIFAVTSYGVGQRMPEVGIRMAFGASPRDVVSEIVRGTGQAVLMGVVLGIAVAAAAMRWAPQLASSFDIRSALLGVMPLVISALVASVVPALRARAASPAELLKRA
jgi:putative ABC transport system permease protein